jgi:hypothetical protein
VPSRLSLALLALAGCGDHGGGGLAPEGPGDYRSCGGTAVWYGTAPIPPADLVNIEPLGHVIAPGHTWPSDHVYLNLRPGGPETPVRAPGSARVWQLAVNTHRYVGGELYTDYTLRFSPCRELEGYFHHVKRLSHAALLALAAGPFDRCDEHSADNGEYQKSCTRHVGVDVAEGDVLGVVGGGPPSVNIDFGAYDTRIAPLGFANPARVSESPAMPRWDYLRVVCPLDAFAPAPRGSLEALLGAWTGTLQPRRAEPRCGTVMQDVPGTAQGIWASAGFAGPWDNAHQLALVRDNFDPARLILATGGGPLGIHERRFAPRDAGLVDRDFADVRFVAGNHPVHCYDVPSTGASPGGRLLVALEAATILRAEVQAGGCAGDLSFTAAVVRYER